MTKKPIFEKINEGATEVLVSKGKKNPRGPGSKQGVPFYNPSMQLNRDLSVVLCQWFVNNRKKPPVFLDGLAASGIRGFRFANEIDGDFEITINDWNQDSFNLINKNIEKSKKKNIQACNYNLNTLLSQNKYDYIDIDPFGSPVYFIDSAVKSIKNKGVIACTATDTATLCGVYPNVCWRRYSAAPFHSVVMKEVGLRILLGFLCRAAGVYDKAIEPLVCYCTDHYFRVYVRVTNGVSKANKSMSNLKTIKSGENLGFEQTNKDIGPLWTDKLQNKKVISQLITILFGKNLGTKKELWKLLDLLEEEADAPMFFYTTDSLASFFKTSPLKRKALFDKIKKEKYDVFQIHFSPTGFKTNAPLKTIEKAFKQ